MITFLHASDHNTKEEEAECFLRAVAIYSVPSRIRVDHGGENSEVCQLMELLRGSNRGSAIRGKNVHNQRIERAWVDIWNGVSNVYYDVFHFLENKELLDVENPSHMWLLHYVYKHRINRDLDQFRMQWNHHGLRTKGHMTPAQMFVAHSLRLCNSGLTAMREMFQVDDAVADGNQAEVDGVQHLQSRDCNIEWWVAWRNIFETTPYKYIRVPFQCQQTAIHKGYVRPSRQQSRAIRYLNILRPDSRTSIASHKTYVSIFGWTRPRHGQSYLFPGAPYLSPTYHKIFHHNSVICQHNGLKLQMCS